MLLVLRFTFDKQSSSFLQLYGCAFLSLELTNFLLCDLIKMVIVVDLLLQQCVVTMEQTFLSWLEFTCWATVDLADMTVY